MKILFKAFLFGIICGGICFGLGYYKARTNTLRDFELEKCWIRNPEMTAVCYVTDN